MPIGSLSPTPATPARQPPPPPPSALCLQTRMPFRHIPRSYTADLCVSSSHLVCLGSHRVAGSAPTSPSALPAHRAHLL